MCRHEAVDRLVVGDAGADCVGERDVAGLICRHQPCNAQGGIRAEGERIEKIVIDAAVDHVNALRTLRCAHVNDLVLDEEIAALDQLDAELVGEK